MSSLKSLGKQKVHAKSGGKCCYCGTAPGPNKLTIDHIKPIAKGGKDGYYNLRSACYDCNRCKGNMDVEEFRKAIELRLDPNFIPTLTHRQLRSLKRHPEIPVVPRLPNCWLNTLKKFGSPVVFEFEKNGLATFAEMLAKVKYVGLPTTMLATCDPPELTKYVSMAGWGFGRAME